MPGMWKRGRMTQLAAAWVTILSTQATADPRCRAQGQYQTQPVVFACDGSEGDTGIDINSFKVAVDNGAERNLFEIPAGTNGFQIEVGADHKAYFILYDPTSQTNLIDESFGSAPSAGAASGWGEHNNHADAADMHYKKTWNGMTIIYSLFLSLPRKEQLRFMGPTPGPLQLRIMNPHVEEQVFRMRYHYDAYTSGPMCAFGAAPTGCMAYYQASARALAVTWATWLQRTYPSAEHAWETFTKGQMGVELIPYYRWCKVYAIWPQGNPEDCWRVWKFLSHGGFEANVPGMTRTMFDFAYKRLPSVSEFAHRCCQSLRIKYPVGGSEAAWKGLKAMNGKWAEGLWSLCGGLPNAPTSAAKDEYLDSFLDADGYQGPTPSDLEYCFHGTNPAPSQTCVWKPAPSCAPTFTYKGATYAVCTKKDHDTAWCSETSEYAGKWANCLMTCEDEGAAQGCFWKLHKGCTNSFNYRGEEHTGCTKMNHNSGWCSLDAEYKGKWEHCTWTCPNPEATVPTSTAAPGDWWNQQRRLAAAASESAEDEPIIL